MEFHQKSYSVRLIRFGCILFNRYVVFFFIIISVVAISWHLLNEISPNLICKMFIKNYIDSVLALFKSTEDAAVLSFVRNIIVQFIVSIKQKCIKLFMLGKNKNNNNKVNRSFISIKYIDVDISYRKNKTNKIKHKMIKFYDTKAKYAL